jgi:hypothetical protein
MNPIINPNMFYYIGLLNNIDSFLIIITIMIFIFLAICVPIGIEMLDNIVSKSQLKKYLIISFIVLLFNSICIIIIPSKDTMYKMWIFSNITETRVDNLKKSGLELKDIIKNDIIDIIKETKK